MTDADFFTVTLEVIGILDRLGVPYEVGGSIASSLHGVYRTTADVDLVADLPAEKVSGFVKELGGAFYADEQVIRAAVRAKRSFNIINLSLGVKIDVFAVKDTAFARQEFARRVRLPFPPPSGPPAWVSSAEDIVLHKLLWYQAGGEVALRQLDDAVGVLKVNAGTLDQAYLARWAEVLGVTALLRQALEKAEPGQP